MWSVIKLFIDLQDGNYEYQIGDVFPREGLTVSEARIAELASDKNRRCTPLIKAVRTKKKATKTDDE